MENWVVEIIVREANGRNRGRARRDRASRDHGLHNLASLHPLPDRHFAIARSRSLRVRPHAPQFGRRRRVTDTIATATARREGILFKHLFLTAARHAPVQVVSAPRRD